MALKTPVYEFCRQCGQRDIKIQGNVVWRSIHRCTNPVPGPHQPPQELRLDNVDIIHNGDV